MAQSRTSSIAAGSSSHSRLEFQQQTWSRFGLRSGKSGHCIGHNVGLLGCRGLSLAHGCAAKGGILRVLKAELTLETTGQCWHSCLPLMPASFKLAYLPANDTKASVLMGTLQTSAKAIPHHWEGSDTNQLERCCSLVGRDCNSVKEKSTL